MFLLQLKKMAYAYAGSVSVFIKKSWHTLFSNAPMQPHFGDDKTSTHVFPVCTEMHGRKSIHLPRQTIL